MNSNKNFFFPLRTVLSVTMADRHGDSPTPPTPMVMPLSFEVWIPGKCLTQICLLMYRAFRTEIRSGDFGSP